MSEKQVKAKRKEERESKGEGLIFDETDIAHQFVLTTLKNGELFISGIPDDLDVALAMVHQINRQVMVKFLTLSQNGQLAPKEPPGQSNLVLPTESNIIIP